MMRNQMIITAASPSYEGSLLALIGSLNCNWHGHPPIVVYDLGMTQSTLERLAAAGIEVRPVPPFCEHWRSDFTWKPWCFRDAPAHCYLWIDAGICVLREMNEAFTAMESLGYFAVALYNHPVGPSVPEPLRENMTVAPAALDEMISVSSGIHGFRKEGRGLELVEEAYRLANVRENMQATAPPHRHDQALLSLLLYKHFGPPILADYHIYAHHLPIGPGAESRQKTWVHRRKMTPVDQQYFARYLAGEGPPYRPTERIELPKQTMLRRMRIALAKLRGRYPGDDRVDFDAAILHGHKD